MKNTYVAIALLSITTFSYAQDLTEFSVFSKTNISYARSDFEGLVGAGSSVRVEDFTFFGQRSASGVLIGDNLSHLRGQILDHNLQVGSTVELSQLRHTGRLSAHDLYLNHAGVGHVTAFDVHRTIGPNGHPTAGYESVRVISRRASETRRTELKTKLSRISSAMDELSAKCRHLPGKEVKVHGRLLNLMGNQDMNVFTIDANELNKVDNIVFDLAPLSTTVINIRGARVELERVGVRVNQANIRRLIWNIYEARELDIRFSGTGEIVNNRAIGLPGVFLAPHAKATFIEALITGSLFVRELHGVEAGWSGGQVNYSPFDGRACGYTPNGGKDPSDETQDPNGGGKR